MGKVTLAQALAVALDHAEDTGELPIELRERIADQWDKLRIVRLDGPVDPYTTAVARWGAMRLCSLERQQVRVPQGMPRPERPWQWVACIHTAATRTSRCRRSWSDPFDCAERSDALAARAVAVEWLRVQMREIGWVLR